MKKMFFHSALFLVAVSLAQPAKAMVEVYKGQSEISDEDTGKACTLTLNRDDKSNEILSLKLEAPAHLLKVDSNQEEVAEDITSGKESRDLSRAKRFSEFRFQKLADVQGEGFMLRGEKVQKSKKDEKLFIHFDIHDGALVGIELAQRQRVFSSQTKSTSDRTALEKICSGLKKL